MKSRSRSRRRPKVTPRSFCYCPQVPTLEDRLPPGDAVLGGLWAASWLAPGTARLDSAAAVPHGPQSSAWARAEATGSGSSATLEIGLLSGQGTRTEHSAASAAVAPTKPVAGGEHKGLTRATATGLGNVLATDQGLPGIEASLEDPLNQAIQGSSSQRRPANRGTGNTVSSKAARPVAEGSVGNTAPVNSGRSPAENASPRPVGLANSLTNEDLLTAGLLTIPPKHKQPPPPRVNSVRGVNVTATEGSLFSGTVAMFQDDDHDLPGTFSATIDWGDGTPLDTTSPTVLAQDSMGGSTGDGMEGYIVTGSHLYQEESPSGGYTITVTIIDNGMGDPSMMTATPTATVADAPVLVTGASPIVGTEGTALNSVAVATFTDPGGPEDPMMEYSASINWGDNNTSTGSITYNSNTGIFTVTGSHTYAEEGSYTVTTTVHHDTGDSAPPVSVTTSADISDAALSTPSVTPITASEGQSYTNTIATFTDPSGPEALADYSAFVNWGDGTSGPGTIAVAGSTFSVAGPHTYADEGSYNVTVTISHDSAGSVVGRTTATISDPAVVASSVQIMATEGTPYTGNVATFTDPGGYEGPADYSASIDWGDGTSGPGVISYDPTSQTFAVNGGMPGHTYAEEGSRTITVTITHDQLPPVTVTDSFNVTDPPVADGTRLSLNVVQNVAFSLPIATFTDPGGAEPLTDYSIPANPGINWGDGTSGSGTISLDTNTQTFIVTAGHTYTQTGTFNISIPVNHDSAAQATLMATATVVGPGSMALTGMPVFGTEGTSLANPTTVATLFDASSMQGSYTATITWATGQTTPGTVTSTGMGTNTYTVSGTYTYAEEGTYPVMVAVTRTTDQAMASTTATATIADPAVAITQALTSATEGQANGTVATFTDPGGPEALTDYSASINWGDGTSGPGTITYNSTTQTFSVAGTNPHSYAEEGTYTVSVTVTHDSAPSTTASFSVMVADAALTATMTPINATAMQLFLGPVALNFADTGGRDPNSDYTISINWGDGQTGSGGLGSSTVYAAHKYAAAGTYQVTVTVTDEMHMGTTPASVMVTDTATVGATMLPPLTPPNDTCGCGGGSDEVGTADGLSGAENSDAGSSEHPVRYFDGAVDLSMGDLTSSGFGVPWGQTRAWSNNPGYASSLNGLGSVQSQLPFLLQRTDPGQADNGQIAVITNGTNGRFFDYNSNNSTYTPHFAFAQESLSDNASTHLFTLTDTQGEQLTFDDFSTTWPVNQRGQFVSFTDAGNNLTSVMSWTNGNPGEVQRSTAGTVESYLYSYVPSGPNQGLLASALLRRSTDGGTTWQTVRQSVYTYYDGVASYGNVGDLQTASILDANGNVLDTDYYRYYTPADAGTIGYVHGLKYVFSPESYARLVAAYPNPFTATDTNVAPYADNYFQYDSQQRVTEEIVQGAGSSSAPAPGAAAGQGIYTYSYGAVNPNGNRSDPNSWIYVTTETLPDHDYAHMTPTYVDQNIVYTNAFGQVMLEVHQTGPQGSVQSWEDYYQYDASDRLIQHAHPSAVSGYNASFNDLVDKMTVGDHGWLNADSGLVELTDYYQTGSGQPVGYVEDTKVQRGQNAASATMLTKMDYLSQTANGITIYLVAHAYAYRTGTMSDPGEQTTYAYPQFWPGTNQIQLMTVTKPVISSGQNGPPTPDVDSTFYDAYGRPIWHQDADGFVDYTAYDQATGAAIKTITDVDYNKLSMTEQASFRMTGWAHPTGGLHLVAQMVVDSLGRTTQLTDPNGNVTYTVYDDPDHEVRTYAGWQSWANRPTGPTTVTREDRPGSYTEILTMSAQPAVLNGQPTGTEPISNIQTLSRTLTSRGGQVTESDAYFNLSGVTYSTATFQLGTAGTNFYPTTSGYDAAGRQNRTQSPTLTIQRTVYDGLDRVVSTWVGLNDVGATDMDPTGGGAMGNDMFQVSVNAYDTSGLTDNSGVGDSNLTRVTQNPGAGAAARVTENFYDWRDRLVATKEGVQSSEDTTTHRPILYRYYDNLDEVTATEQYDGDTLTISSTEGVPQPPPEMNRRARTETSYDDQGRAYQSRQFDIVQYGTDAGQVAPNDTMPLPPLVTNTFYTHRGQVMATAAPGGLWTKSTYDGAGRIVATYTTDGLAGMTWTAASSPVGDNVLTQTETSYDANGNSILVTTRDRFHNETATGPLGTATTAPLARVSYVASYYDALDRLTDQVNVGTNGGAAYTWNPMVPGDSDTVLVTHTSYNAAGWVDSVTDPRGLVTKTLYDNLGRAVKTFDAYTNGTPTNTSDRETDYTYDGDGHTLTVTAVLPGGVQQQTQYTYDVTIDQGSAIDSNDLLQAVTYPGQTQQDVYTYDALGEPLTMTDRNGTTHSYVRDVLGRLISDQVTLGAGVDPTVQRLDTAYDTGDRPYLYTSYHDVAGTMIANQVEQLYNGLGQLIQEYQAHGGAVVPGTTPSVQYAYTEMAGGSNNSRLISMTYPNGRQISYSYGNSNGMGTDTLDNTISRLTTIADSSGILETYIDGTNAYADYLGLDTLVQRDHPQPNLTQTYIAQMGDAPTGDAGDQYIGLDRFGRVVDQRWFERGQPINDTTDRFQYGYDRDGNVLYRANWVTEVGLSTPLPFDELYGYDNFNQLTSFGRGTLNGSRTALLMGSATHTQSWTLDPLGNWDSFTNDGTMQTRTNNVQNQITSISGATTPSYDTNGNTTQDDKGNQYVYDAWNRLVKVTSGANTLAAYSYDALGRRIQEVETNSFNDAVTRDLYFSAQWQVLEEHETSASYTNLVRAQYVWSPVYVDALVERDRDPVRTGSGRLSERVYVQQDANWNVTALVAVDNPVGIYEPVERYVYDPYGKVTIYSAGVLYNIPDWTSTRTTSAYAWVYLFQGGREDTKSGLYDFRNRDYSPTLGRWMQEDPLGYGAGDTDLYGYVHNDPITRTDPTGLVAIFFDGANQTEKNRTIIYRMYLASKDPHKFYEKSLVIWKTLERLKK